MASGYMTSNKSETLPITEALLKGKAIISASRLEASNEIINLLGV
jgi:hypothetical protein